MKSDKGMNCRFDNESELTPDQRQEFRDRFVEDCIKKDQILERNILTILAIPVMVWLSYMAEDFTLALVMVPLMVSMLFLKEE